MIRISVPRTPPEAYNPDRPAGTLLLAQLKHLEWAVRPAGERLPGKIVLPANPTEREVAARLEQLMKQLHGKTLGREPIIKPARPARKRARAKTARAAKASPGRKRARRRPRG